MTTDDEQGWRGRGGSEPASPIRQILDRLDRIERRQRDSEVSSPLRSAAISEGDLTVKDGGSLVVRDGGGVRVEGGGSIDTSTPTAFASIGNGGLWLRRLASEAWGQIRAVTRSFGSALRIAPPGGGSLEVLIEAPAPGTIIPKGRVYVDGGSSVVLEAEPEATSMSTASVDIDGAGAAVRLGSRSPAGLSLGGLTVDAQGVSLYGLPTTSSPANIRVSDTPGSIGLLSRSTSSLRYKTDVQDAALDVAAVLKLRPRTWRDRLEVERDPATTVRHIGFIAEELDALGLRAFVSYDAAGPESIYYDRLVAALVPVVQAQQRQIDELRALVIPTPKEGA